MYSIDLVKFAEHSQKIPTQYLGPNSVEPKKSKIIFAHLIDFCSIYYASYLFCFLMDFYFMNFMNTERLFNLYTHQSLEIFNPFIFTLTAFAYYFTACFFNSGKTLGMHYMKSRIQVEGHNFQAAFLEAIYRPSLFFTLGLSSNLNKKKSCLAHDHLYHSLMNPQSYFIHSDYLKTAKKKEKEQIIIKSAA
ncbi:MAG: RDD family protein [Bacteriovoracaceae bacterium]